MRAVKSVFHPLSRFFYGRKIIPHYNIAPTHLMVLMSKIYGFLILFHQKLFHSDKGAVGTLKSFSHYSFGLVTRKMFIDPPQTLCFYCISGGGGEPNFLFVER